MSGGLAGGDVFVGPPSKLQSSWNIVDPVQAGINHRCMSTELSHVAFVMIRIMTIAEIWC